MKSLLTSPISVRAAIVVEAWIRYRSDLLVDPGQLYRGSLPNKYFTKEQQKINVRCQVCDEVFPCIPSTATRQGCPSCAHYKHTQSWGKKRYGRIGPKDKAEIIRLRALGLTHKEIAEKVGWGRFTVSMVLNPKQREVRRKKSAEYRKKNPTRSRAASNRWGKQTDHGRACMSNKATFRRHNAEGDWIGISPAEKEQILDLYKQRDRMNKEAGSIAFHIDHIYPVAKGGAHAYYNLRIITAEDNIAKGARVSEEDWSVYQLRVAALFTATN